MTTATKKAPRRSPGPPTKKGAREGCSLCTATEKAIGTLHSYRIGPKCLQIIENIAAREGIPVPLREFNPFKKKTVDG
jgi:hypothetical protein